MPLLSIIIPTYNQGRFIAETIQSALTQTHTPLEVIVVDDGSTDSTREALQPFMNRIAYIHQKNRGPAVARNVGFLASRGEYLLFLDGDDRILPEKCARHIALMEEHPEQGVSYSSWQQISEDGQRVFGEVYPGYEGDVLKPLLLRRFFIFPSAAVVRRGCLRKVGLFDERFRWADDADLWMRLALAGYRFGYLPEALLQYRLQDRSLTAQVNPRQVQDWLAVHNKFFSMPGLPPDILALEAESLAVLHFETAGRYFRSGSFEAGAEHLRSGVCPPAPRVRAHWFLEWLAGTALDPRTPDPESLMDAVFDHLPEEAGYLRRLRRNARGHFHVAATFSEYNNHNGAAVSRHLWPAIRGEPAVLLNPGFLSILLKTVTGRRK